MQVNPLLQLFMWQCIDDMPPPKDYLQIFKLSNENGQQKITHIQEEPEYKREYLLTTGTPIYMPALRSNSKYRDGLDARSGIFEGKIFVIDDETHSTMLLAEEY